MISYVINFAQTVINMSAFFDYKYAYIPVHLLIGVLKALIMSINDRGTAQLTPGDTSTATMP